MQSGVGAIIGHAVVVAIAPLSYVALTHEGELSLGVHVAFVGVSHLIENIGNTRCLSATNNVVNVFAINQGGGYSKVSLATLYESIAHCVGKILARAKALIARGFVLRI